MKKEVFDVVIIGAGPSGAVAGAMLAQLNRKVLIIEKEYFPRFSIGESLLPQCMAFLSDAGLVDAVHSGAEKFAFQFKNGAAFSKQGQETFFDFTQKFSEGPGTTYQVKRADFDNLLAQGAQDKGVEIRYGHQVLAVDVDDELPSVTVKSESGEHYTVEGKFLLDASGFGRVLPRLLDLELPSSFPVRHSYFAHFQDNICDANFDRDKILITVHPEHQDIWYWLIPFSDGTASVGVVGEPEKFDQTHTPEQVLLQFIEQAPNLKHLLADAKVINSVQTIRGYSADVTRLHGDNYALLGNAGEFLDPVFSSGVTIALKSASLIVPLIEDKLNGKKIDLAKDYAAPLKQGVDCFRTFVSAWYDGRFQDVIFFSEQEPHVRGMISSILAGYAWDLDNPYVAQSERRFNVLHQLCKSE
ncbi:NAD(P)/FAD-dependent oxidoreductase [Thalassotalea sp. PLHSN55]|uniref:NAD(P)/FAD-dependent oxidoreductase n=1 Tax=Thalassotalea sp. PLHSN55 TaxID=3435888 RepID=UPI003F83CC3A